MGWQGWKNVCILLLCNYSLEWLSLIKNVMYGCVYVWVLKCVDVCLCGFCNVWVCVSVGFVMCGFCNVWVCVCVGFVMCGCVYVWVL